MTTEPIAITRARNQMITSILARFPDEVWDDLAPDGAPDSTDHGYRTAEQIAEAVRFEAIRTARKLFDLLPLVADHKRITHARTLVRCLIKDYEYGSDGDPNALFTSWSFPNTRTFLDTALSSPMRATVLDPYVVEAVA